MLSSKRPVYAASSSRTLASVETQRTEGEAAHHRRMPSRKWMQSPQSQHADLPPRTPSPNTFRRRIPCPKWTRRRLILVALLSRTDLLRLKLQAVQRLKRFVRRWRTRRLNKQTERTAPFVRAAGALLDEVYRKRAADRMLHFLNVLGSRRHVFALRKAFRGVRLAAKVLQCAWRRAIRTSRARLEQLRSVWASVKERKLCELQNWAKMLVRMGQGPPAAWLEQRRDEFERRKARILRALPKTPRRPAFGPRRSSGGRGRRGVSGEEARALDVSAEHRDAHLKRYLRTRAGKAPRYALSGLCAAPFCASYGPFNGPFGVDDARDWVHGDHVDRAAHVMVTAFRNRKPTAPAFPDFRGLFSDVEVILRDAVRQRCVLGRIDSARRCLLGGAWRTWKLEMSARKLDGKRDSARPAVENCPQIAAPCGRAASARTPRGGGVYGGVAKPPPSGWVDMFIPSADKACSFRTRSAPTSPRSAEIDGAPPRCAVIEGASPRSALMGGEPKRLAGDSRRDSRRDSKRAPCSDENFAAAMSSPFPPARAKSANAVNAHRRHF